MIGTAALSGILSSMVKLPPKQRVGAWATTSFDRIGFTMDHLSDPRRPQCLTFRADMTYMSFKKAADKRI
jgi:hypothetical protein